ncbi:MAG: four-carbon acid sugar kinase family protein [Pseudomonadota bacterium]|nr:four-carbon acid sugar kinase family protein [Pseudomonadota bacterium]
MITVRLLADDLTGALDAMAEFSLAAAGPLHAFWHGSAPCRLPPTAAIDTGTREVGADLARSRIDALAPMLLAGDVAFKKVDSLMRGPTLAEIAALAARPEWESCVFAPAFPAQGRITRGGQQFKQAGDTWCPVGPNLVQALHARHGTPGDPLGVGITIFDAETDADLEAIVAAARNRRVLWCGTAGLARAVADMDAACSPLLPRPVLGLFGSDHPASVAQLHACTPHWLHWAEQTPHDLAARLADGFALVSVDLPPGLPRDEAATRIGRALHRLASDVPRPGTLLVAGGETLRGLCLALGADSLELLGRILPGLPRSVLRGGAWDGVTVVSKSGAFGPPSLWRDLLARNGLFPERTT